MALALVSALGVATAAPVTFGNSSTITIPDTPLGSGTSVADPYPSEIEVSGLGTDIRDVNLTPKGFSHEFSDDVDVLVVGPQGQKALVMSDVGDVSTSSGVTLTFDDSAVASLPDSSQLATGTSEPTCPPRGPTPLLGEEATRYHLTSHRRRDRRSRSPTPRNFLCLTALTPTAPGSSTL
jgi:hypothetical protein